jgi:type II secretory pathway pseudopilin PulG
MSLIEATVIMLAFAILAMIVSPTIGGYVNDAQQASAKRDVEAIAAALTRMLGDVGEGWFVRNGARTGTATNQGAPSHGANTRVDLLVSSGGAIPPLAAAPRASGTDWDDAVNHAAIQTLDNYLVLNMPSNNSANAYRTGATYTGSGNFDPDEGRGYNATFVWRGAYASGPIGGDPWGSRYAANVEFLARTQGTTGSGSQMDVVVLSAGGNRMVDTPFERDGTVGVEDDVVAALSGATR